MRNRNKRLFALTGSIVLLVSCSDGSPTSPNGRTATTATTAASDTAEAAVLKPGARNRTVGVVAPRGSNPLLPGVWGSDQASLTVRPGSATLEIFAQVLAGSGCFGSYGDIAAPIPDGRFSIGGTFTQLTGVYPGKFSYSALCSGEVEGNRMSITIKVPATQSTYGPYNLVLGVTNSWEACRYP